MVAAAVLAIVIQTSPAAIAGRSPGAVLARSETSTSGGRRVRLLVRIDSQPASTGVAIDDLIANVREIWRPYAEIDFAEVGTAAATGIHDDELRLIIADRLPQPRSATAAVLGWIEFVDGRPRNTVTVSVAAARSMMAAGKWLGRPIDVMPRALQQKFVTRALSRSAAHEIGHYLLRSRAHAARGLMRERMTVAEIMDDAPALCRLLPGEVGRLDQRLAGALVEAPPSDPRDTIVRPRARKS